MDLVEVPGEAFLAKTAKSPGAPPAEHLVIPAPFLAHQPFVIPGTAFTKEQPLEPSGPAPSQLFALYSVSWHPEHEPFPEHFLLPPIGTLNYHGVCGHGGDFAPYLFQPH